MEMFGFERAVLNRQKGQHEYVSWSIKANTVLVLHKKAEILHLLRQEFDPRVTKVAQESYRIKLDDRVINIPIVSNQGDQLKIAIFDASDTVAWEMSELCKKNSIHLDIVDSKFNRDSAD